MPGESITVDLLNQKLKELYKTGYFADVKIENKKGTIIVSIKENPTINQIAFEGNPSITEKILKTDFS